MDVKLSDGHVGGGESIKKTALPPKLLGKSRKKKALPPKPFGESIKRKPYHQNLHSSGAV